MGLAAPTEPCIIRQAMYGLVESPKDWGAHRDETLRKSRWWQDGVDFALVEIQERHVWRVTQLDSPETEHGYLVTYVDDMLIVGNKVTTQRVLDLIREQCSQPEFLSGEKPLVLEANMWLK